MKIRLETRSLKARDEHKRVDAPGRRGKTRLARFSGMPDYFINRKGNWIIARALCASRVPYYLRSMEDHPKQISHRLGAQIILDQWIAFKLNGLADSLHFSLTGHRGVAASSLYRSF